MKCDCPRGLDICHHVASFALHCMYNVSATDLPCQWNKSKTYTSSTVETIDDLYPSTPFRATQKALTEEDVSSFKAKLREQSIGFSWILLAEPNEDLSKILPNIEDVFA